MSVVVQVAMGSSGNAVLENYTIGDVLICKAHRGKLQEIAYLVDTLQADINYCNQVQCSSTMCTTTSALTDKCCSQAQVREWNCEALGTIDWRLRDAID